MESPSTPTRKGFLPECWNDDLRMSSLFSPRRSSEINPQDWKAKESFWKEVILKWCHSQRMATFSLADLRGVLTRDGRTPHCLTDVLKEMQRTGDLITSEEFSSGLSNSWVTKVAGFVFQKLRNYGVFSDGKTDNDNIFICLPVLKEYSVYLLHQSDKSNDGFAGNIKSMRELEADHARLKIQPPFSLVVQYLQQKKLLAVFTVKNELVAKLSENENEQVQLEPEIDIGMYNLKKTKKFLEEQSVRLQEEVSKASEKTTAAIKAKQRVLARSHLLKKKAFEKRLGTTEQLLLNVEDMIEKIQDAHSQQMVIQAYESGTAALRKTMLSVDKVNNVMMDVEESFDLFREVETSISTPVSFEESAVTDEELENELKELTGTVDVDTTVESLVNTLPDLPNGEIHGVISSSKISNASNKLSESSAFM